jgi:hypothetical protein
MLLSHSKFMPRRLPPRLTWVCLALLAAPASLPQSQPVLPESKPAGGAPGAFPSQETLTYGIEWRLIRAGSARLSLEPRKSGGALVWETRLHVESAGLVAKLYKLEETYAAEMRDQFCTTATDLDSVEGKRHRGTKVSFDYASGKASYIERDLIKDSIFKTAEVEIPACVADFIGGLYKLRTLKLEPGESAQVPMSDGKKSVMARVEAQNREEIKNEAGTFNTIRCEAYLFNGVLYARKAQVQVWLTDDARRLPVQVRARMSFPTGSITFELEKDEHS